MLWASLGDPWALQSWAMKPTRKSGDGVWRPAPGVSLVAAPTELVGVCAAPCELWSGVPLWSPGGPPVPNPRGRLGG
eukprot:15341915-Alexandrium_andersonii.AAC.1